MHRLFIIFTLFLYTHLSVLCSLGSVSEIRQVFSQPDALLFLRVIFRKIWPSFTVTIKAKMKLYPSPLALWFLFFPLVKVMATNEETWHSSIHFQNLLNPFRGHKVAGTYLATVWQSKGTPWTCCQSVGRPQHSHSYLETPVNPRIMILDCGRNPECLWKTHGCSGRTCKLHTKKIPVWIWTWTFLLWGKSANRHITVEPDICGGSIIMWITL